MHGFWVSTEVFIDDVEGYLWGEGKKLWEKMSDREQWDCFDWMCDNVSIEDETGDIDDYIVMWYKKNAVMMNSVMRDVAAENHEEFVSVENVNSK